jgi:hypothetical protein
VAALRTGLHPRQHAIYERNLVVIVDVRALVGRTATPIGWALFPVFENGTEYVASGAFQLPLFQGAVQLALMQDLVKAEAEGRGVEVGPGSYCLPPSAYPAPSLNEPLHHE